MSPSSSPSPPPSPPPPAPLNLLIITLLTLFSLFLLYTTSSLLTASELHVNHAGTTKLFDAPLCSDGVCGESATTPTRRGAASCRTREQLEQWDNYFEVLRRESFDVGNPDVVFLGDSITESFRGTSIGAASERAEGIPGVFSSVMGGRSAWVSGISGDQTQHLMYRMREGSTLPQDSVYVVNIGTNNLGAGMTVEDTFQGIKALVNSLKDRMVLVSGLLPRGDCVDKGCFGTMDKIAAVNQRLKDEYGGKFVECGYVFVKNSALTEAEWVVESKIMPDLLHPGAEGVRAWFDSCLGKRINSSLAVNRNHVPI